MIGRGRISAADLLLAALVTAVFGGWSVYVLLVTRSEWWPVPAISALAGPAALALRGSAPVASFAVVSLTCALEVALAGPSVLLPSVVAFPLSAYSVSAWGPRWAPAASFATAVAGAALVTVRLPLQAQLTRSGFPIPFLFGAVLAVVLVAWSLGLFRRVQLAYLAAARDRAVRAEAEREERARVAVLDERTRIAREMHDVVAHSLSVIVSQAQGGVYAARSDPGRAAEVLTSIAETGRQALADMRGMLGLLRTDAGAGGVAATQPLPTLAELPALLERVRASGIELEYMEDGVPQALAPTVELTAYRLVQEALTNAIKHAGPAARVRLRLGWSERGLRVEVRDDGIGSRPPKAGSLGLIGMRERVGAVGGSVNAGPGPDGGFVVEARLPPPERGDR